MSVASDNARYWTLVRACLVEFHHFSAHKAMCQVRGLRKRLVQASQDFNVPGAEDMVYHDEALRVADGIAEASTESRSEVWNRYLEMQEHLFMRAGALQSPTPRRSHPRLKTERSSMTHSKSSRRARAS